MTESLFSLFLSFLPLIVGTKLDGCWSSQQSTPVPFKLSLEDFGLCLGELGALPTEAL
jgi:hypothetical protein